MEDLSSEELQQQEAAGFEAGFAEASGHEPPPVEVEAQPEPQSVASVEPVVEVEEIIPEFGLTPSAIRQRLAKIDEMDALKAEMQQLVQHRDRQYGTIGDMKQRLQQMETRPSSTSRLNISSLKRLSGEYPELAELLAQDLNEAIETGSAPAAAFDPQQIEELLAKRTAEVERRAQDGTLRQVQQLLLARDHPDWKDVAASADFSLWKSNLDPQERTMLDNSWDSNMISSAITAYKSWQGKQQERTVSKRNRLERAIQPNGVSATNDTAGEVDAFLAGFNAIRSQRI